MSDKGHKGAMGLPGGIELPQWAVKIIDFRNDKYLQDCNKNSNLGEVDKGYEEIDKAISEMMKINIPDYGSTGPVGNSGGCHNGCPEGRKG